MENNIVEKVNGEIKTFLKEKQNLICFYCYKKCFVKKIKDLYLENFNLNLISMDTFQNILDVMQLELDTVRSHLGKNDVNKLKEFDKKMFKLYFDEMILTNFLNEICKLEGCDSDMKYEDKEVK